MRLSTLAVAADKIRDGLWWHLPNGCHPVSRLTLAARHRVDAAVLAERGKVAPAERRAITTALQWHRFALLVDRAIALGKVLPAERRACRRMARVARRARDKGLRTLGLDLELDA